MSEPIFSPLHSETVVLERTRKPLKRITMKKRSSALRNDSEDMFDPLTFTPEQQKAYNKTVKARENYHKTLDNFRKLFPTKEGGKTRRSNYRGRK
jgi:hypothetical protein